MGIRTIIIWLIIFALGFGLGWLLHIDKTATVQSIRENSSDYKFINPLLFAKSTDDQIFPQYAPLKETITDYIKEMSNQDVSDVSVYFRNLNSGQWVYINPNETFTPASMLKVITLISVLRVAESDPALLNKKFTLRGADQTLVNSQMAYHPAKNQIRIGHEYTVKELLDHLIIESDNVANAALIELVGKEKILKTYNDLRLPEPNQFGYTAEQYSHLFRVLYNGTYLSRSVSEQVLELLSKTSFEEGIVAAVPPETVVSHKFGVHIVPASDYRQTNKIEYRELHDCGIVYYPDQPYFLCIMTRGQEFPTLETVIKNISTITWQQVSSLNKKKS